MEFLNNWSQPIVLGAGATSAALGLPDGGYTLTIADTPFTATAWEIVEATVVGGFATLVRAQEGTTAQDWSEGSVIYCSLTAGWLQTTDARTSIVVSEEDPDVAPTGAGALHVGSQRAYIALGTQSPDDWVLLWGSPVNAGGFIGVTAEAMQVGRTVRDLGFFAGNAAGPVAPLTTVAIPFMTRNPADLRIEVLSVPTDVTIALALDFSAQCSGPDMCGFAIEQSVTGVSATYDPASNVLAFAITEDIEITMSRIEVYVDPDGVTPTGMLAQITARPATVLVPVPIV